MIVIVEFAITGRSVSSTLKFMSMACELCVMRVIIRMLCVTLRDHVSRGMCGLHCLMLYVYGLCIVLCNVCVMRGASCLMCCVPRIIVHVL